MPGGTAVRRSRPRHIARHGIRPRAARRRQRSTPVIAGVVLAAVLAIAAGSAFAVLSTDHPNRSGVAPASGRAPTAQRSPSGRALTGSTTASTVPPPQWQVAWGSTMAWGYEYVNDATVRSLARIPVDATAVRVRISNQFGSAPLVIGAASIGRSTGGGAVSPATLTQLRFAGAPTVTVPVGGWVVSDAVAMPAAGAQTVAVSIYVSDADRLSAHYPCCEANTPSYLTAAGTGDMTAASSAAPFGYTAPWSRLLDAVYVQRPPAPPGVPAARGSIVVIGDSITDGFNSTARWTDLLAQRISTLPEAEQPAIVNEANTANTLTAVVPSFAATGGGPPGVERLARDALDFPGVATVVVFLGTNDLYFGAPPSAVIAGLEQVADETDAAGIRPVAVTLLPRDGSEGWNPLRRSYLQQVNQWLESSHVFAAVVDLDAAIADVRGGACDPNRLYPPFDSGDHLHPDAAGDAVIADAIDPSALGLPPLAPVPLPASAAPATPGCAAGPGPIPTDQLGQSSTSR